MDLRSWNNSNRSPLRVYCKNCGTPAGFDIVRQTYRCSHCGELTGIQEAKQQVYGWRELQQKNQAIRNNGQTMEEYNCPSCGAHIVFPAGDASITCDFCGGKLIRKELLSAEQMPELIIPFFITPGEARRRILDWGHEHQDTPEGRSVVSNIGSLKGYYLPYQLVCGPVSGTVTRDGNKRKYRCAGYLEGTAVNTTRQLDNLVLNEMEPFDWSAARPFEYGYIAGQKVKLSDLSDAQTDARIREEVAADFLLEVEKVMQSSGVDVQVETGNMSVLPVLLPVYFIKSGKLTAVMNGQTGRIAVSKEREKKRDLWMIEPMIYTLIGMLLMGVCSHFALYPMALTGFVLACIFFSAMGEGRHSLIRRVTLRTESAKSRRENGELKIDERRDILKNPYDNTPVFYEPARTGGMVPVKIRFYSFGRWLSMMIRISAIVFLPAIIAAFFRWVEMGPGEVFMDGFRPEYGAAWYALTGVIAILYLAKGVRRDVYEHPILYEILPGGKKRRMGKRADRKIRVLAMFGIGQTDSQGKKVTLFRTIGALGGIGIFMTVVMLAILIGSIVAILS